MAREIGRFNTELLLFQEQSKPNLGRMRFFRWLIENKAWEHPAEGRPTGEFAMALVIKENKPVNKIFPAPLNDFQQQH